MTRYLVTAALCMLMAVCGYAQKTSTKDFAARFMQDNADRESLECATVGPKMMGRMLAADAADDTQTAFAKAMDGIKSIRIITGKNAAEATAIRKSAVKLLKANRKRYSAYKQNGKTPFGDCLWTRRVDKSIVELVYVAPETADKAFMAMDFTGKISDDFISQLMTARSGEADKQHTKEQH